MRRQVSFVHAHAAKYRKSPRTGRRDTADFLTLISTLAAAGDHENDVPSAGKLALESFDEPSGMP
jgi:hypothetical protein